MGDHQFIEIQSLDRANFFLYAGDVEPRGLDA